MPTTTNTTNKEFSGESPGSPPDGQPASSKKRAAADYASESGKDLTPRKRRRPARYRESPSRPGPPENEHDHDGGSTDEATRDPPRPSNGDRRPDEPQPEPTEQTPAKRRPGRPKGSKNLPKPVDGAHHTTPSKSRGGGKWTTPVKTAAAAMDTPRRRGLADRSARRKSARALIDRVVSGATSDDEVGDHALARTIYQSSGDEDEDEDEDAEDGPPRPIIDVHAPAEDDGVSAAAAAAASPVKRRPGRPKGSTNRARDRLPTPPRDLPPHERYFFQNKPGSLRTSGNKLSTVELLTHDEYFDLLRRHRDPHRPQLGFLRSMHADSFRQWEFELSQGFSLCLYGYGSKRALLHDFAADLHRRGGATIVVVNGYAWSGGGGGGMREALATMARAVDPTGPRLPSGVPVAMAQGLAALLAARRDVVLTVVVNSIDALEMRRGGTSSSASQAILAQLAAHPQVRLVCSADTPDFPLLWDAGRRSLFNFAMHDCTTFAAFGPAELDVVDEVHELLGRKALRVGGKDGVIFVLRSLPENAKNLFRLLVTEALVAMDDNDDAGGPHGDLAGSDGPAVEYRTMYNKAVEEFICSSEMAFRTLLKEFYDHQIITSRKDAIGTELLCLPFHKQELESILEDLMS